MDNIQTMIDAARAERAADSQQVRNDLDQAYRSNRSKEILSSLLDAARNAPAFHERTNGDQTIGIVPRKQASATELDLRALNVPRLPTDERLARALVPGSQAQHTTPLSRQIVEQSLVAQAGAQVIFAAERPSPSDGNGIVLYRDAGEFLVVDPAPFAAVAEDADATDSALPIKSATITWPDNANLAFRTVLTRRQQKDAGYDLEATLLRAIIQGLARAADKTLLAAIVAGTPTPFTLAKAVARGLEFNELRALVGTAGAGAAVDASGKLRAAGILAELTPVMAETLVGSFARAAVAVYPTLNLVAERTNTVGDLSLTVYANMQALVPDAVAFWTVA